MYSFLRGTVASKGDGQVVLDVNGVGYELLTSGFTVSDCADVGTTETLLTYLVVKEDALTLIGFKTASEKEMFLSLIDVNGVGASKAMQALSAMKPDSLALAISSGNVDAIVNSKAASRKNAELIVLKLKSKFKNYKIENGEICAPMFITNETIESATLVLTSLGLTKKEAAEWAEKCYNEDIKEASVLVQKVLRSMNK